MSDPFSIGGYLQQPAYNDSPVPSLAALGPPPPAPGPPGTALPLDSVYVPPAPYVAQPSAAPVVSAPQAPSPNQFMSLAQEASAQNPTAPKPVDPNSQEGLVSLALQQSQARNGTGPGAAPKAQGTQAPLVFHKPTAGQAGGATEAIKMGPAAGTTVKAHEVALVDPKRQKALYDDQTLGGAMRAAVAEGDARQLAAAQAGVHTAQAEGLGGEASTLGQTSQLLQSNADKTLQDRKAFIDGLTKLQNEKAQVQLDPDQYRKSVGPGGTVVQAIGAALASVGQGFLHESGPNPVLEAINRRVEQNIDAQKENFSRKRGQVDDAINTYKLAYEATGDHQQAMLAARGVELQKAKTTTEQIVAQSNDPVERARGAQVVDTIDQAQAKDAQQAMREQIGMNRYVPQATAGAIDMNKVRADAKDFMKDATAHGHEMTEEEALRRAYRLNSITSISAGTTSGLMAAPQKGGDQAALVAKQQETFDRLGHNAVGTSNRTIPGFGSPLQGLEGTDAYKNVEAQQKFNTEVLARVKAMSGFRNFEDVQKMAEPYLIKPGSKNETIQQHIASAQNDLPPVPVKAGGGDGTDQGAP